MRWWQIAILIIVSILVVAAVLTTIPTTSHLSYKFWGVVWWFLNLLAFIGLGLLLFIAPALAALLLKLGAMCGIDKLIMPRVDIPKWVHWVVGLFLGLAYGAIHSAVLMPLCMGWNTWVRRFAMMFGWSGFYETPNIIWFFWAFLLFWVVYGAVPYYDEWQR